MTIDEARNTIKSLKDYYNDKREYCEDGYVGFDDADNKALDMASRALEVVQGMEEVFIQELTELDMRDVPEEERNSLWQYIDSISKSTGVKFDFNGVKTELEPCEDCVSRQEFEKRIKPYDTDDKMDKALYNFAHNILISCTSVQPQSLEQIKWERDTAIEQLEQLGYGLGEKVKPCEDCVSRKELLSRIDAERRHLLDIGMDGAEHIIVHHARRIIEDMPSVKPQRPNRETEIWERIKAYIMSDDFMNDYPEDVTAEIWRMRKELEDLKND